MRAFAVAFWSSFLLCGTGLAGDGQIEIGPTAVFPIVLSQPGSYLLTTDLSTGSAVDAIRIDADHVTLDLGGHLIQGVGTANGTSGVVAINHHRGATVRNGVISNFENCVNLSLDTPTLVGPPHTVEGVRVVGCQTGMYVAGGMIVHSTATQCLLYGFWGSSLLVDSSLALENGGTGFRLAGYSSCTSCVSTRNSGAGFVLSASTCTGCTASLNDSYGFELGGGALLTSCLAYVNSPANLSGSCSSGNACLNSYLP